MRPTPPSIFALGLALSLAPLAAACGGGSPGDDDPEPEYLGGAIEVPGCGFSVHTRSGAEAPVFPGADGALGADPAPHHLRLGFAGDPSETIAILWRTDVDTTATQVQLGTSATALDTVVDGVTYRYLAGLGGIDGAVRVHEVHVCGLAPDTEYFYRVGGAAGGAERWSPVHAFRTAPDIAASPDAEVRIGVIGDSRDGYTIWGQLAAQLDARGVDMILFTGDAVTIGQFQEEWDLFLEAAQDLLTRVPIVSAHGNHELNAVNFYSIFAQPGDESDFSFDFGHAHFTVLNDSPVSGGDLAGRLAEFLDADLAAAARPWKIVSHHRALWSSGTRHGSDSTLRGYWGPAIDRHHADLVIAGHDHIYERTKPMYGDEVRLTPDAGTIYLVVGGAGASLYNTEPQPFTEISRRSHGAGVVSVRASMLTGEFFDPTGALIDQFTIVK